MKKIGLIVKEASKSRIKNTFKSSKGLIIVKYSGVSSPDMSNLRKTLKASGWIFLWLRIALLGGP